LKESKERNHIYTIQFYLTSNINYYIYKYINEMINGSFRMINGRDYTGKEILQNYYSGL